MFLSAYLGRPSFLALILNKVFETKVLFYSEPPRQNTIHTQKDALTLKKNNFINLNFISNIFDTCFI